MRDELKMDKSKDIEYIVCDMKDVKEVKKIIESVLPDEIYNLGAQSDARVSIEKAEETMLINGNIVLSICETIKCLKEKKEIRLFQANSSELYKGIQDCDNNHVVIEEENINFRPKNPYGISKLLAYWTINYYRENFGLYLCNGIIFNAESKMRKEEFLIKKITNTIKEIKKGTAEFLVVGDLNCERDWIHASDVSKAIWLILQQKSSADYIISMNDRHSVREAIERAFELVGINIKWEYKDGIEVGTSEGKILVKTSGEFIRSYEKNSVCLIGNNEKLKSIGWIPEYNWETLLLDNLVD